MIGPPDASPDPAPIERVARAKERVRELGAQVEKLGQVVAQQRGALTRLGAATSTLRLDDEQRKAMRHALASLMLFEALGEQIAEAYAGFERPVVDLLDDVHDRLRNQEQLAALSRSADALNSSLDLSTVLGQALNALVALTRAERAFLMLEDRVTGRMEVAVVHNLDRDTIDAEAFATSRTLVETAAREGRPVVTTDAQADPRFRERESVALHRLRSIICAPLKNKERIIGVVYADNRAVTDLFTEADRDFVVAFANQAAVAIENARLFERVALASNLMRNVFDSITSGVVTIDEHGEIGLFNRAAEQILALPAERCLHRPADCLTPLLGGVITDLAQEVREQGRVATAEEVEGEIDGRGRVCVTVTAAPLTDASDGPLGVALVVEDRTEGMRFRHERALVKRYLPTELVESFADLADLQLGGARETVTVFFADIRGFTAFAERRDPTEVVEAVNDYFGLANEVIHANHGIVDKYMGDAIMAHFNSPLLPAPEHAWLAVKTAWLIRERVAAHERAGEAGPSGALRIGVGINTGEALAGNIGAPSRMEYTLIGDAVNLARRLQESARPGQILLGEQTYARVAGRVQARVAEVSRVKGRSAPVRVYELIGLEG